MWVMSAASRWRVILSVILEDGSPPTATLKGEPDSQKKKTNNITVADLRQTKI